MGGVCKAPGLTLSEPWRKEPPGEVGAGGGAGMSGPPGAGGGGEGREATRLRNKEATVCARP